MMVRNHLDDQAMSKLLMKSTHYKIVLEAHKKVLEAHKIVLEAHKSFCFSSMYQICTNMVINCLAEIESELRQYATIDSSSSAASSQFDHPTYLQVFSC